MKTHANWLWLCFIMFLSVPIIFPLFHDGLFPMHDDTQVVRVIEMGRALQDGQFPVRWVENLGYGYGYPIFNFYSPLPYYIGGIFYLLGLSPLLATKLMIGFGMLLAGILMFLFSRKFLGNLAGLLSAVLYQYAPYHAVQSYVRGSVGELWAYALLPLVMYGIVQVIKKSSDQKIKINYDHTIAIIAGAVGFAGVILSHNISAMLLTILLLPFVIVVTIQSFLKKSWNNLLSITFIVLLGLGLSAFFWLSALAELKYTRVDTIIGRTAAPYHHLLYLDQLWDSPWGYAGSAPGRADGMSFKLGKVHVILALVGCLSFVYFLRKRKDSSLLYGYMVILLLISTFLMLEQSRFVWEAVPVLDYVQYPWRLLVFALFSLSFLAGGVSLLPIGRNYFLIIPCAIIILLVNVKYFQPQQYTAIPDDIYTSERFIKWEKSKISDEYLPKGFQTPRSNNEIVTDKFSIDLPGTIETYNIQSSHQRVLVTTPQTVQLTVHTAYFPGWKLFVDDKEVIPLIIDGILTTSIPPGTHEVILRLTNTPIRLLGNSISLFSLAALFSIIIKFNKKVPYAKEARS